MFTGIVEATGIVRSVILSGTNRTFWIESAISAELKTDQSVSHNGTCLTVEEVSGNRHRMTAIEETLRKTNLGNWQEGTLVNLERCLQLNGRIDGHLVQGHVDATGTCISKSEKEGSWEFIYSFPPAFAELLIEKGSVCVNGISLTAFDVTRDSFKTAIIPYTFTHTNMHRLEPGDPVNLEFDMVGKYLVRRLSLNA